MQWLEGLVIFTGAVLAWALGLFVLSRGGLRRIPLLTAAATFHRARRRAIDALAEEFAQRHQQALA